MLNIIKGEHMLKNFNQNLIQENDHLIVAVSGGIDSMVLLDNLIQLKKDKALKISIAHVDHHKRNDSFKDADFVKDYAKKHLLDFYLYHLKAKDYHNFHNYAHKKRYDFFVDVAHQSHGNKIVLAHHLDDLAETIMMRLIRGSSFEGYQGMNEKTTYQSMEIIRPMLYVPKNDIIAYQKENNIEFREDSSNQEDDYTRNRYRHHIMPLLEKENPQYLDKMKQFSAYISKAYDFIQKESSTYLNNILFDDNSASINQKTFLNQSEIVQIESIKQIINRLTHNQLELSYQNINDIISTIGSKKPHLEYHLGDQIYIYKSYDNIAVQIEAKKDTTYTCVINDFGLYKVDNHIEALVAKKPNKSYDYIYKLCYNNLDLTFPIVIRNRRPGDRLDIQIGTKKLKDFFIDKKVPMKKRNQLPLVVDQNQNILFIPSLFSKKQTGKDDLYIHLNIQ
jgi:tRNA(Ile)-lysidine synthetase-like protein